MNESFVSKSVVAAFMKRQSRHGHDKKLGALIAAGSFEVLIDGNNEALGDGEGLGTGLAQITSRLLHQLETGAEHVRDGGVSQPRIAVRDVRGSRVPVDSSPLVTWKPVTAMSDLGSILGLVSLPEHIVTP
jgi:hypothetical protein